MYERRGERRVTVLKQGKILLSGCVALNCAIRDISAGGAHIELDGPYMLPPTFHLRVVSAGVTIAATVRRQRRREAGLRFTGIGIAGPLEGERLHRSA